MAKAKIAISMNIDVLEIVDKFAKQEYEGNRSLAIQKLCEKALETAEVKTQ